MSYFENEIFPPRVPNWSIMMDNPT